MNEALSRKQVGNLIRQKIDAFGEDAWFINNGWCHAFAIGIVRVIGPEARIVNSLFDYKEGTFPGHSWIEYRGMHFELRPQMASSGPPTCNIIAALGRLLTLRTIRTRTKPSLKL